MRRWRRRWRPEWTVRSGSTRQPGRVLHRRVELPAGARSAWSCRGRSRPRSRRSPCAGSSARRCCPAAAAPAWPGSAATPRSCSTGRSTATALVSVDPAARTCVVEPGIVLDVLNGRLERYGLEFGPQPATHDHCTLGGMIGNNSCGATAQRTGKVVDNVAAARGAALRRHPVLGAARPPTSEYARHRGGRRPAGRDLPAAAGPARAVPRPRSGPATRTSRAGCPATTSTRCCRRTASTSRGRWSAARARCVTVLRAELTLVPVVKARSLVVLGYPSTSPRRRTRCRRSTGTGRSRWKGMDDELVGCRACEGHQRGRARAAAGRRGLVARPVRRATRATRPTRQAQGLIDALARGEDAPNVSLFDDPERREAVVGGPRVRARRHARASRGGRTPGRAGRTRPSARTGWATTCATSRRSTPSSATTGRRCTGTSATAACTAASRSTCHRRTAWPRFRAFVERAADLVVSYGGSLSGEHGDGQARGELLPRMFGPELVAAFRRFKAVFDPDNRMNPGKVVTPYPAGRAAPARRRLVAGDVRPTCTSATRTTTARSRARRTACVGVGKCRQHSPAAR